MPETTVLGLQPGDVFVHRNIANIVSPTDINSSAVIEYAVAHLKVKHIVLCGHTSCGGAAAALGESKVGGVLDTWLTPLRRLKLQHKAELEAITDAGARAQRLAELNVALGCETLMANVVVEEAVRERGLRLHGVLFDIPSGKLRDLNFGNVKGADQTFDKSDVKGDFEGEDAKEELTDVVGRNATKNSKSTVTEPSLMKGNHGRIVFGGDGAGSVETR